MDSIEVEVDPIEAGASVMMKEGRDGSLDDPRRRSAAALDEVATATLEATRYGRSQTRRRQIWGRLRWWWI